MVQRKKYLRKFTSKVIATSLENNLYILTATNLPLPSSKFVQKFEIYD